MVVDSLIIENKYDYTLKYSHISDVVDLKSIKNKLSNNQLKNIDVINIDNLYSAKKVIQPEIFKLILDNKHSLSEELEYLTDLYETSNFNDIIAYYLIELVVLIELKKQSKIDLKTMYKYLTMIDYIPQEYINHFKQILFYKKEVNKSSFEKNTNIMVTNKNSYEFPKNIRNLKNLEMRNLIQNIDLPLLEIPNNKDSKKIIEFLYTVLKLKKSLKLKKWNFSLRIKKTKKDNEGMYITNANTIVVDPRYPEAFYHELGHYIYENKLAFTHNDKRYYPCHFDKIVTKFSKEHFKQIKLKKDKMEEYSDSSEIFSVYFDILNR